MQTHPGTRRTCVATAVRRGIVLGSMVFAMLLPGAVRGQSFSEFPVPTDNGSPYAITAGPDGNVWFTESLRSKIGRITMDGVITEFPVPSTQPSGITTGPDGNLWFTEGARTGNRIGRITPAGDIEEFSIPTRAAALAGIAAGPDGNLWFTEFNGDKIGRITTSGTVTEYDITSTPNGSSSRWPFQITAGPDGNLWFTEVFNNAIGRMTPQGVLTEFPVSTDDCPTRDFGGIQLQDCSLSGIAAGPDGNLWYLKSKANKVGRITTTGTITEFTIPSFSSEPFGITAGPDGNLWFTESKTNKTARITTAGVITEFVIPTDDSGPYAIATGPDGALWFAEHSANKIGRMTTSTTGPCAADSKTLCLKDSRFKVQLAWSDPARGRSGVGTAIPLTEDTGYFWFFNSANVELVIKALDGRSVNNHFWIFYGALSNVQYTITVTDTVTGNVKTYENPAGTLASVADTAAFGTSGAGIETVSDSVRAEIDARSDAELYGLYAALTEVTAPPKAATTDLCVAGGTVLCLNQSRFLVSVDWSVPSRGRSGQGTPVVITDETGYFWFFNGDNVELVVKVLDARSVNGHFWVFYGALSNVQYTITITDTQTQDVKTYTNPDGTLASVADTNAF